MRPFCLILGLAFLFGVACFPLPGLAKGTEVKVTKEGGPVDIEADHLIYDREEQLYQAHGHVEVTRGDFSLKADHARYHLATREMMAWGNVILVEGEDVLECERLEVNLETRRGKVYQAKLFLKGQNYHIVGREAEKLGENQYRIREGSFTTCDASRPDWKFTMKELEVTVGGNGIAKGPIFYVEDVPVFYLPTALFPVKKERQTGFLLPGVGNSSRFGPEVKTAFYWAISKEMDATVTLERLGDNRGRGFKEDLEYRYAFTNDTTGQAAFHFSDDQVFGKDRSAFFLQHQQKLPSDFYLKSDINYVSDRLYVQDFDEDLPEKTKLDSRSLKQLRSVIFGGKDWDRFSFLAEGAVYNDLTQRKNDETVQKLPQVSFYAHPQSFLSTPFFYDFASSYTSFWREKGVEAQRVDVLPRISYPVRLLDVLKVESDVGFRETVYRSYRDPTGEIKGWKSRETAQAAVSVSSEFYRVYEASQNSKLSDLFKVAKWMHTVEPTIGYQYSPKVDQDKLPQFDEVDRIPFTSQITYGITQRLIGKPQKETVDSGPYEYARLRISQSYSLGEPFEQDETKGKFSNVKGELWWNLNPYLYARGIAEFNPYRGDFDVVDGLVRAKDRRNDVFQLEYRFTKDKIKGINFLARARTIDQFYVYGAIWYNLFDRARVENIYGVEYQSQCWMAGVIVEDRASSPDGTQKREVVFQVYVNLLGVGAIGHKPRFTSL